MCTSAGTLAYSQYSNNDFIPCGCAAARRLAKILPLAALVHNGFDNFAIELCGPTTPFRMLPSLLLRYLVLLFYQPPTAGCHKR